MRQDEERVLVRLLRKGMKKSKDRKTVLLEAAYKLLKKQDDSSIVLNLLEETIFYDEADCDGSCLMEDIDLELRPPT